MSLFLESDLKIVGIDSGSRGCVLQLDSRKKIAGYLKMPFTEDKLLDFDKLERSFSWSDVTKIFIEDVRGRGGIWGASQNFTFGFNYGMIRSFLINKQYTLVSPKQWQKVAHIGIKGKTAKEKSKLSFNRLSSENIKHDGIIDAFHIARYGLLLYPQNILLNTKWTFLNLDKK